MFYDMTSQANKKNDKRQSPDDSVRELPVPSKGGVPHTPNRLVNNLGSIGNPIEVQSPISVSTLGTVQGTGKIIAYYHQTMEALIKQRNDLYCEYVRNPDHQRKGVKVHGREWSELRQEICHIIGADRPWDKVPQVMLDKVNQVFQLEHSIKGVSNETSECLWQLCHELMPSGVLDPVVAEECYLPVVPGHVSGDLLSPGSAESFFRFRDQRWLNDWNIDSMARVMMYAARPECFRSRRSVIGNEPRFKGLTSRLFSKVPVPTREKGHFGTVLVSAMSFQALISNMDIEWGKTFDKSDYEYNNIFARYREAKTFIVKACQGYRPQLKLREGRKKPSTSFLQLGNNFVFPCNIGNYHWVTVVITVNEETIRVFDFLGNDKRLRLSAIGQMFLGLVVHECANDRNGDLTPEGWKVEVMTPQYQTDGSSCGCHTIMVMWECLRDPSKPPTAPRELHNQDGVYHKKFRSWMAICFFNDVLHLPTWELGYELLSNGNTIEQSS